MFDVGSSFPSPFLLPPRPELLSALYCRLIVPLGRLLYQAHSDRLCRNLDPAYLTVDNGTDLLNVRFEFPLADYQSVLVVRIAASFVPRESPVTL